MEPIAAPPEAVAGRPECELVDMGPPPGVPSSHCGTAQMLISPWAEQMPGFRAKRQYAYYRPTEQELEDLRAGGFLELCQIGSAVQPFSLAVWPAPRSPERLPHADVPGLTPETCPGREAHGNPFRYCPEKG